MRSLARGTTAPRRARGGAQHGGRRSEAEAGGGVPGAGRARQRGREQGQGKGGPGQGAPGQPGRLRAGPRPTRPGQPAREPGQDAGTRARAHPLRAHARLAFHLLPWGGADHGVGPVDHAPVGADGPGVRRRAPVQLRHLRLARAQPGVRLQRLRRDVARPVGMGREAAGGQRRRRGARAGFLQDRARRGGIEPGPGLPPGHAADGRHDQPGGLVLARRGEHGAWNC